MNALQKMVLARETIKAQRAERDELKKLQERLANDRRNALQDIRDNKRELFEEVLQKFDGWMVTTSTFIAQGIDWWARGYSNKDFAPEEQNWVDKARAWQNALADMTRAKENLLSFYKNNPDATRYIIFDIDLEKIGKNPDLT